MPSARIALLLVLCAAAVCPATAEDSAVLLKLEDVLSPEQLARIEAGKKDVETPEAAIKFTFDKVPNYGKVTVYYAMENVVVDGRVVRRAGEHPAAVVYVVLIGRYSELRRHLNDYEFVDVLEQIKALEDKDATLRTIKVRRGVFDVGRGTSEEFLKDRDAYYDARSGEPIFGAWPKAFRPPVGKLTTSVVQTTLVRGPLPSDRREIIEARQFFGYVFPELDKLLTDEQKKRIDDALARTNVTDGAVTVDVGDVKDVGASTLHYMVAEGRPLAKPTALSTTVILTSEDFRKDPLIARKYLAPDGAKRLVEKIREGESKTRTLKAVEIRKVYIDLDDETTDAGKAAVAEFRKHVDFWCTRDGLLLPAKWPGEFRRPDGTFDIELAFTRLIWRKEKRD